MKKTTRIQLEIVAAALFCLLLEGCTKTYRVMIDEETGPYVVDERILFLSLIAKGAAICLAPSILYFVARHKVSKQVIRPYKEAIYLAFAMWVAFVIWFFSHARGESGLASIPLVLFFSVSSAISSLFVAAVYQAIIKIRAAGKDRR